MFWTNFPTDSGNKLCCWYYQIAKNNRLLRKYLVEDEPEIALRLINVFNDKKLAGTFITAHRNKEDPYHHAAYFLSVEYWGKPIRRNAPVETLSLGGWPRYGGSSRGHIDTSWQYEQQNSWDNVVRLYEERMAG